VNGSDLTIDQLLLLFLKHAERHYRRPDGTPTEAIIGFKNAARPLHRLYGHTPAVQFGPKALKAVRRAYIDADNCRTLVNSRVGKIRRIFAWAVEEELIPPSVIIALATVAGLEEGRTDARASEPVGPVDSAIVDATLPFLNRHVAGLVQLQRLTGARPGEAMAIRRCDIDTTGAVWLFAPPQHKTKHKGKERVIAIGPKARELLKGFFTDDPTDYRFSPRRAVEEFRSEQSTKRKTPRFPSHYGAQRDEAGWGRAEAPAPRQVRAPVVPDRHRAGV
jgi:integrase